jgi:hypothetical protein
MKRILFLLLIGILLVSGCEGLPSELAGMDQTAVKGIIESAQAEGKADEAALLKGSTQTMTPFQPVVNVSWKTPVPGSDYAQADEWITATRFEALASGKARLYWDAGGDFPEGFKVVWSNDSNTPVFPDDIWDYISDGSARSAEVFGNPGEAYYFRVCKYSQGVCLFYSPVAKYTFEVGQKTATPSGDLSLKITSIQSGGSGKANVYWDASGSFPKGFKVVWSESTSEPVFPGNSYQYLSSPAARSTQVEGTPGKKVYFRVCRYDGSKCDFYSNTYTFTFIGSAATEANKSINITSISNVADGKAKVVWNAAGSFPKGFKVVWSSSSSTPVYPGNDYVYMSDPSARSAKVNGTAGKKYYFRVCEYLGGSCGIYSNTYEFTFSGTTTAPTADASTISITSVTGNEPGKAVVSWSANGSFPSGFKVVWSASNTAPVYPGNEYIYLSDPSARSATLTGTLGQTIYIRVGKYISSSCNVYSNMVLFTFTSPPVATEVPTLAPTEAPTEEPTADPTEEPTEEATEES